MSNVDREDAKGVTKRDRGRAIIDELRDTYLYSIKRIARDVGEFGYVSPNGSKGAHHCTISRIANPNEKWSISDSLLDALQAVLCDAREKFLSASLPHLPIKVIDFCGVPSEPNHLEQVEDAVKSVLHAHTASPRITLPDGIEGVLVAIGCEEFHIYMILVDCELESTRRTIVAHELDHIANRLRDGSEASEDDDSTADV